MRNILDRRTRWLGIGIISGGIFLFLSVSHGGPLPKTQSLSLGPDERLVTLLATNDIHGGVEPSLDANDKLSGGLALWSGTVKAIRLGLQKNEKYSSRAGVLLLDAGDQFQGTLISNYNEGELVFAAMNSAGYDAAIPGNHDYDFGPIGWLVDQSGDPTKRLEALTRVAGQAKFPLLSENTYFRNSIQDKNGNPIVVDNVSCKPKDSNAAIDWSRAKRPPFLADSRVFPIAGVKVAVIGLDNAATPKSTTEDNVSDLCFADVRETYLRVRASLANQADIFVMVVHDGDTLDQHKLLEFVKTLAPVGGARLVDVVISGHTHFNYSENANGVPVIQSGSGGKNFGRVDLVWNTTEKALNLAKTRSLAGIRLLPDGCDEKARAFCSVVKGKVNYEGVAVTPDATIEALIVKARAVVQPLAGRRLGKALKTMNHDRTTETSLSDVMTDALRANTGADVAFLNGSGLRASIRQGDFTYEDLFRVFPFNNREVIIGPMSVGQIVTVIQKAIKSCGTIDSLMQSGLHVTYQRNCEVPAAKASGIDDDAKLLHVETLAGEVLYDASPTIGNAAVVSKSFKVATLDFLANGGSGYATFKEVSKIDESRGIFRENLTDAFLKAPVTWSGDLDGRWKDLGAAPVRPPSPN